MATRLQAEEQIHPGIIRQQVIKRDSKLENGANKTDKTFTHTKRMKHSQVHAAREHINTGNAWKC